MITRLPYKNINDTLKHMKIQIIDSLPFACKTVPEMDSPEELFDYLKERVRYKNDPKGVELLQTMQTLMLGKFWGTPGYGDCDCFVITTLACMICQGWNNLFICLVARESKSPVHIYTVIYWNGQRQVFDLTNRNFNHERSGWNGTDEYNFKQEIPVRWEHWKNLKFNNN